jgi:endonuclease/exonuclease/phosphatase family metal-dependent hydrolase
LNRTQHEISEHCNEIKVVSANLWHDWPYHRNLFARLELFAQIVESQKAQLILLQESTRRQNLWVDQWLAHRLNMSVVYARANGNLNKIGFEEGVALLSRFEIDKPQLHQFQSSRIPFIRRVALAARVKTPCGNLLATTVHLSIGRRSNFNQLASLREWTEKIDASIPVIIGGDFNAHEESSQIKDVQTSWVDTFRHLNPNQDGATHALHWPWGGYFHRRRLDYIFLKNPNSNWQILESSHLANPGMAHSDHRAVFARLAPCPVIGD